MYEARELEANALTEKAKGKAAEGKNHIAAETFRQAEIAYRAALDVGRSDAGLWEALGRQSLAVVRARMDAQGEDLVPYCQSGIRALDSAIRIDRDSTGAQQAKAQLLRLQS